MKNYAKGTRFEREIMERIKELQPNSHVARTGGSHGWFDVIGIVPDSLDPSHGTLHLIQAKSQKGKTPTKSNRGEWEKMKLIEVPKIVTVKKEMWIRFPGGGIIAWGE